MNAEFQGQEMFMLLKSCQSYLTCTVVFTVKKEEAFLFELHELKSSAGNMLKKPFILL